MTPLVAQSWRRKDEYAICKPAGTEFRNQQTRLNGLAEAHIVGEQEAASVAAENGEHRLELVRKKLDVCLRRDAEQTRSATFCDQLPRRSSPPPGSRSTWRRRRNANHVDGIERHQ